MIIAWSGYYGVNLYNTFWILLIAYVVKELAFGIRMASGSLEQLHDSLEEAARSSGATWTQTFRDVVLPLIRPALLGGAFLVFILAFRDLTMSILLYGSETPTAGVALYELQSGGYYQSAAALAVLVLGVVLLGNWAVKRLTKGAFGI
jgi:iron(III) transport system permease protein